MTARRLRRLAWAGLVPLSFLAYGSHVFDPPLSDDFVALRSAQHGLATLVRAATVDSYPRTIRPLPALLWGLRLPPADLSLIHIAGLATHGANGALVGLLSLRLGAVPAAAALSGAAFVIFPLFAEPVLWASCGPDRLATLAGLLALCIWTGGGQDGRRALALRRRGRI